MKQAIRNIGTVLRVRKYALIGAVTTFLYYALNVITIYRSNVMATIPLLGPWEMFLYVLRMLRDHYITVPEYSFIILVTISILFGLLVMLILYKTLVVTGAGYQKKGGFFASFSFFIGLFASSCVACGIGVFSAFGVTAALLSFLPFGGIELSILAILILLGSVYQFAKNLYICKRI